MLVSFRRAALYLLAIGIALATSLPVRGQALQLPLSRLSLDDMSAFRSAADNWKIAGGVQVDRSRERVLQTTPGDSVLANQPTEEAQSNLFTRWEHGDLTLELDYMMPEGSNSGIYLMGRYEVQLLDSWGAGRPTFADAGGIYQRWDADRPEGERGYEGHPPRFNVSRAPGLWQHLKIVFQAPRFNEEGDKVANAQFVKVVHNGVVIHENVEVTGPTRAAAFQDEAPKGPLMIQGDHGPVAFRNIRYRRAGRERVALEGLRYRYYEGEFEGVPDVAKLSPVEEGRADQITWRVSDQPENYALAFEGTLNVPASGTYFFGLETAGASRLLIEDETIVDNPVSTWTRTNEGGTVELEAGTHPFKLIYSRGGSRQSPALGFFAEGPNMAPHPLHDAASLPQEKAVDPIYVELEDRPVILRSFITHGGKKRTYSVSVGEPSGIHYSLDVARAAPLQVWKGAFLNTTPMWHSRGNAQLALPRGSVVELAGTPSVALLSSEEAPWPDSLASGYQFKGYALDKAGRPTFRYQLQEVEVEDHFEPGPNQRTLNRTMRFSARNDRPPANLWARLASGNEIEKQSDGSYAVNDYTYFIDVAEGSGEPIVRQGGEQDDLLLPVRFDDGSSQARVEYAIIW